jgi:hypothetical protein
VVTGKFSLVSVVTEGMGDILWGHDWGPGQVHLPVPPMAPLLTPSLAVLLVGSTTKYFLPSFALKEAQDGAIAGGSNPVAVSLPVFIILTQQCQDSSCALSFVGPSSICYQQVSVRWVGFCLGDVIAGAIAMGADALAAFVLSKYGGQVFKNTTWDDQLLGGLGSSFMGFGSALAGLVPGGYLALGSLGLAGTVFAVTGSAASLALLAPLIGYAGGALGSQAGEWWGSEEGDWGPKPEGEPPPAEPPAEPEPSDAGAGGADAGPPAPDAGTEGGEEPDAGVSDEGEYCEPDEPAASYPEDEPSASYPEDQPDGGTSEESEGGYSEDSEGGYSEGPDGGTSEPPDAGTPDEPDGGYSEGPDGGTSEPGEGGPSEEPDAGTSEDEPNASYPDDEPNASYPDDEPPGG